MSAGVDSGHAARDGSFKHETVDGLQPGSPRMLYATHEMREARVKIEPRDPGDEESPEQHDSHAQVYLLHHLREGVTSSAGAGSALEELCVPPAPAATPVAVKLEPPDTTHSHAQGTTLDMDEHMTVLGTESSLAATTPAGELAPLLPVKEEPLSEGEQQHLSGEDTNDSLSGSSSAEASSRPSVKSWSQQDMDSALEALRTHNMSLTKASLRYGIPSTTLWQRAHRMGIDTPKKETGAKSWTEQDLNNALHALRTGAISANKASKAYGIPSSTLYKIARREGIRLAAPFNAAPTAWSAADLERALHAIRAGHYSVQRASTHYGIPTGTLYGRCKREGIELSRSNPTPWSEDAMGEALEAVRVGQMSINQAAIHYNLPYSSLYGRFKRCKYQLQPQTLQHPYEQHQESIEKQHHSQEMYGHYPSIAQPINSLSPHSNLDHMQQTHHHRQDNHHIIESTEVSHVPKIQILGHQIISPPHVLENVITNETDIGNHARQIHEENAIVHRLDPNLRIHQNHIIHSSQPHIFHHRVPQENFTLENHTHENVHDIHNHLHDNRREINLSDNIGYDHSRLLNYDPNVAQTQGSIDMNGYYSGQSNSIVTS